MAAGKTMKTRAGSSIPSLMACGLSAKSRSKTHLPKLKQYSGLMDVSQPKTADKINFTIAAK